VGVVPRGAPGGGSAPFFLLFLFFWLIFSSISFLLYNIIKKPIKNKIHCNIFK
jgi:hypothetical protein